MFVARQWIRHRTANVNEYSGRYSLMPMLFYTPPSEQLQKQSASNKQGRSGEPVTTEEYSAVVDRFRAIRTASREAYEWMTANEIARELSRIDLPLSTYTQWYWKIDLHNLLHFLTLRVDTHAQWEIREFGRVMAGMLKRVAPLSFEAWLDYDVCGAPMSRMELEALRKLVRVEGDTIVGSDRGVGRPELEKLGLSGRESRELMAKLAAREVPSFDLDLSAAQQPDYFARRFADAVPKVDRPPPE
jgi:thymidylate synthase (FAD)